MWRRGASRGNWGCRGGADLIRVHVASWGLGLSAVSKTAGPWNSILAWAVTAGATTAVESVAARLTGPLDAAAAPRPIRFIYSGAFGHCCRVVGSCNAFAERRDNVERPLWPVVNHRGAPQISTWAEIYRVDRNVYTKQKKMA